MTDLEMWAAILGAVLPMLIAVVQQPTWPSYLRSVVTAVICVVVGAGNAYFQDQFTGRSVISSVLLVLVSALATYQGFWRHTVAPSIETATSPRHALPRQRV